MIITSFFAQGGVPKTSLTPTITVYKVSDNSVVVNAQTMTEISGGFYKYDFTTYSSASDYVFTCDGGSSLANHERYSFGGSSSALTSTDVTSVATGILSAVIEGTLTTQQVLMLCLAVLAGKTTGGGTANLAFRDNANTKNRVLAVVDTNGNRTTVTLDAT